MRKTREDHMLQLASLSSDCCNARINGISRMSLPQLLGLTEDEEKLLWALSGGRSLSEFGLDEGVSGGSPCLSGSDEVEILP